MLTASLISLTFPFLTQSLVDTGIGNSNMAFVVMILVAQLILSLSQTVNGLLRNWISLHVTSRVSISLISDFLIKLMKLPISFFDVKLVGDIMQRIGDHARIESFLTGSSLNTLFSLMVIARIFRSVKPELTLVQLLPLSVESITPSPLAPAKILLL